MRGQHRSAATFNNPNLFCEYLSMVMPVVLYTMIQEINQESRYVRWFIAAALLAMAGVLFSMSRGGYIALLTVLLIFLASKPQRVLEIGAILLLVSLFLPSSVTNELVAFSSAHGDMTERAKAWEICLQAILERPIFGYGAGCGSVQQILAAQGLNIPHAHNLILEVLTEGGLVAFALLTAIEWHILRGGFRLLSSPYAHWLGVVCIAFISAFFVHGLVDYPLLTPKVVHTFLMMVGLFASSYRLYFPSPAPDQTRSLPTDGIGITASR
jgi:O-antigen ligase